MLISSHCAREHPHKLAEVSSKLQKCILSVFACCSTTLQYPSLTLQSEQLVPEQTDQVNVLIVDMLLLEILLMQVHVFQLADILDSQLFQGD